MATVDEIKDKLPIVLKSKTTGLIIQVDSISNSNEGIGYVVGGGNGVNMSGHRAGDYSTIWHLTNFSIFEG